MHGKYHSNHSSAERYAELVQQARVARAARFAHLMVAVRRAVGRQPLPWHALKPASTPHTH